MIENDLNAAKRNFLTQFNCLSEDDKQKGISSSLIAEWINREIEFVEILMPLLDYKKFTYAGCIYWISSRFYDKFRNKIESLLLG